MIMKEKEHQKALEQLKLELVEERIMKTKWKNKYKNMQEEFQKKLLKLQSEHTENEGKWKEKYKELEVRFKNYKKTEDESESILKTKICF